MQQKQIFKLNIINVFNRQGKTLKHKMRNFNENVQVLGEKNPNAEMKKKKRVMVGLNDKYTQQENELINEVEMGKKFSQKAQEGISGG